MAKKNGHMADRNQSLLVALRILYWIFFAATVIVFYYSLRQTQNGFRATLYALALWMLTYLIHLGIKKIKGRKLK